MLRKSWSRNRLSFDFVKPTKDRSAILSKVTLLLSFARQLIIVLLTEKIMVESRFPFRFHWQRLKKFQKFKLRYDPIKEFRTHYALKSRTSEPIIRSLKIHNMMFYCPSVLQCFNIILRSACVAWWTRTSYQLLDYYTPFSYQKTFLAFLNSISRP